MNRTWNRAVLLVCVVGFLVGLTACGGGNSGNQTTGTNNGGTTNPGTSNPGPGTSGSQASAPEYLFWSNPTSGTIVVYSIDSNTGALTQSNTVQTNLNPLFAISSDPEGKYLYASGALNNATTASTIGYTIDHATGKLSIIAGSPFGFGVFIVNQVNPANFIYAADNITNQLHTIAIDPQTGALTRLVASTPTGGDNPYSPRLNSTRNLLAVANQSSNTISVFSLNSTTGAPALVPGAPFSPPVSGEPSCPPKGGCGSDVAFVDGFLYYGNAALAQSSQAGNDIFGFSVAATGGLTPLMGSFFLNPSFAPQTMAATQDGRFLYVANAGGGVVGYSIGNSGNLTLVTGSPYNGSGYIAVDAKSRFLYVGDSAHTNGILGYMIDSSTGALSPISGTPIGAGAQGGQIVIR